MFDQVELGLSLLSGFTKRLGNLEFFEKHHRRPDMTEVFRRKNDIAFGRRGLAFESQEAVDEIIDIPLDSSSTVRFVKQFTISRLQSAKKCSASLFQLITTNSDCLFNVFLPAGARLSADTGHGIFTIRHWFSK